MNKIHFHYLFIINLQEKLVPQGMADNIEFLFEVVEFGGKEIIKKVFQFFKVIIFIFK